MLQLLCLFMASFPHIGASRQPEEPVRSQSISHFPFRARRLRFNLICASRFRHSAAVKNPCRGASTARNPEACDYAGWRDRTPAPACRQCAREGDRPRVLLAPPAGERLVRDHHRTRRGRKDRPVLPLSRAPTDAASTGDRQGDHGWAAAGGDDAPCADQKVPGGLGGAGPVLLKQRR